jgi:hypothetical protein
MGIVIFLVVLILIVGFIFMDGCKHSCNASQPLQECLQPN